jgi:hypothetical protein
MTALHIIGWWVVLNCTVWPFLIWLFFRRRRRAKAAINHWIATHPTCSTEQMPAEIAVYYFQ